MSAVTAEPAPAAPSIATQDLVLPMVPSAICSLVLEAISQFNGTTKIGLAAALGAGLWWFQRRPSLRSAATSSAVRYARSNWRPLLFAVVVGAVLALVVTRAVFGRPTIATALVVLAGLAITTALAYRGRRSPAALTSAIAGGLVGLCVGIAVL